MKVKRGAASLSRTLTCTRIARVNAITSSKATGNFLLSIFTPAAYASSFKFVGLCEAWRLTKNFSTQPVRQDLRMSAAFADV